MFSKLFGSGGKSSKKKAGETGKSSKRPGGRRTSARRSQQGTKRGRRTERDPGAYRSGGFPECRAKRRSPKDPRRWRR